MHALPCGEGLYAGRGEQHGGSPEQRLSGLLILFTRYANNRRGSSQCVCAVESTSRGLLTPAATLFNATFQFAIPEILIGGQFSLTMREWAQTLTTQVRICAGNELHHVHLQLPIVPVNLNSTAAGHGLLMSLTAHTRTRAHTSDSISTATNAMPDQWHFALTKAHVILGDNAINLK